MTNSAAVRAEDLCENTTFNQSVVNEKVTSFQKPKLTVVPPTPSEPPTQEKLVQLYSKQNRECWLCEGISKKIVAGKDISDDDNWHFTSCVLSWEHLNR